MAAEPTPEAEDWTFEALAAADRATLERALVAGTAPDFDQLDGYAYRGWNHEWIATISGRKFKKAFHERDGLDLGYNELVRQDGRGYEGDWEVKTSDGRAIRLGYYRVARVSDEPSGGPRDRYRHLALLDYNLALNGGSRSPLRVIRDFVALPNPGDHGLLLGKAYLQLGLRRLSLFYSYFILGHREPSERPPW